VRTTLYCNPIRIQYLTNDGRMNDDAVGGGGGRCIRDIQMNRPNYFSLLDLKLGKQF
jgi:hypothetical protein